MSIGSVSKQRTTPKKPSSKEVVDAVLDIFRGARVVAVNKPLFCPYCDGKLLKKYEAIYATAPVAELVALIDKTRGKIVEAVWPDGRREWQCHRCGRAVKLVTKQELNG